MQIDRVQVSSKVVDWNHWFSMKIGKCLRNLNPDQSAPTKPGSDSRVHQCPTTDSARTTLLIAE